MNTLLNAMKNENNIKLTENGGIAYKATDFEVYNKLSDLFAFGGAYRSRTNEDRILLFKNALDEDEALAMKCLFYSRDAREGQGERQFFRVICKWLAKNKTKVIKRNLEFIPEFGRWDDFYAFVDTPLENDVFNFMYSQLKLDLSCKTPSLLAKWLKSENTSSLESRKLGAKTRKYFHMTSKEYRKTLSSLREKIRIVERLMGQNRWDEIEFDKLPSKAGFIYRNAFASNDITRERYRKFIENKETNVNARTLYPCEVVQKARVLRGNNAVERATINKYWDNLKDYFHNSTFNGVAVVDTSGSMIWSEHGTGSITPMDVAIALGMYCAEKSNKNSPWFGHYITFSHNARLVPIEGFDFVDKVERINNANLCENTNIESVFDLILYAAVKNHILNKDMPKNIIIISDMEFDKATAIRGYGRKNPESVIEKCLSRYRDNGYDLPHLIFWNVNARNDTIPMRDNGRVSFVSGYSPVLFEQILSNKSGIDLMLDKLLSERYSKIY